MIQEGQKNMKKLDNNLKMAQADLDDMNNMKRVVDEKKRIHTEKMQGLENENNQLNQEIGELKELLAVKQKTLNNLKKRNEQSKKNKKKLIEIHNKEVEENASNKNRLDVLNESDDIGIKNGKKNNIIYRQNKNFNLTQNQTRNNISTKFRNVDNKNSSIKKFFYKSYENDSNNPNIFEKKKSVNNTNQNLMLLNKHYNKEKKIKIKRNNLRPITQPDEKKNKEN